MPTTPPLAPRPSPQAAELHVHGAPGIPFVPSLAAFTRQNGSGKVYSLVPETTSLNDPTADRLMVIDHLLRTRAELSGHPLRFGTQAFRRLDMELLISVVIAMYSTPGASPPPALTSDRQRKALEKMVASSSSRVSLTAQGTEGPFTADRIGAYLAGPTHRSIEIRRTVEAGLPPLAHRQQGRLQVKIEPAQLANACEIFKFVVDQWPEAVDHATLMHPAKTGSTAEDGVIFMRDLQAAKEIAEYLGAYAKVWRAPQSGTLFTTALAPGIHVAELPPEAYAERPTRKSGTFSTAPANGSAATYNALLVVAACIEAKRTRCTAAQALEAVLNEREQA